MTKEGLGYGENVVLYLPFQTYISAMLKGLLISEICWIFVIWTVKYSILAFYWRIFSANRRSIRIIIRLFAAAVTIWGVLVVGARPFNQRSLSVGRSCRISDYRLVTSHSIPMCSYQLCMEPLPERVLPLIQQCDLRGLVDTTCRHRLSASGLSNTINLESSYA